MVVIKQVIKQLKVLKKQAKTAAVLGPVSARTWSQGGSCLREERQVRTSLQGIGQKLLYNFLFAGPS